MTPSRFKGTARITFMALSTAAVVIFIGCAQPKPALTTEVVPTKGLPTTTAERPSQTPTETPTTAPSSTSAAEPTLSPTIEPTGTVPPPILRRVFSLSVESGSQASEIGSWGAGTLFDSPNITNSVIVSGGQSLISYDAIQWTGAPDEPTTIRFWDIPSGQVVQEIGLRINYQGFYASSDGRMIGTVRGACPSESSQCTLDIRDTSTGEILLSIEEDNIQGVTFSPDDRYLAFSGPQGIQLWDIAGKQLVRTLADPSFDDIIRFSHDEKFLAASTYLGVYVRVWDLETGTQLAEITSEKYAPIFYFSTMAFSPDDNTLAICINGIVDLYDTKTWSEGESWEWHQAPITAIAYSPDGRLLATGAVDGSIVLGTAAGEKLADLSGHKSFIKQLLFTWDGNWLMSTSWDGTLRFWGVPAE